MKILFINKNQRAYVKSIPTFNILNALKSKIDDLTGSMEIIVFGIRCLKIHDWFKLGNRWWMDSVVDEFFK